MARNLIKYGVEVEIVSTLPNPYRQRAQFHGINYSFIHPYVRVRPFRSENPSRRMFSTLHLALFSLNLESYLKKQRFDILHTHLTDPYFYLRLNHRHPVVFQPWEEIHTPWTYPKKGNLFAKINLQALEILKGRIDKFCIENADAVASESEEQAMIFKSLFSLDGERIFHFPVGVDIEYVLNLAARSKLSRNSLGFKDSDFVLVSANRLEYMKGLDFLIDAVGLLRTHLNGIRLIIVGTGPYEGKLRERISSQNLQDRVVIMKNVAEMDLYRVFTFSDVYVSPGYHYISVTGVLEAMACGLPIISTVESFHVRNDTNGFVVSIGNASEIADAVMKIYDSNNKQKFGRKSYEISREYDYNRIVQLAIHRYDKLLSNRS